MQISPPYLMFLGDVPDPLAAKTAYGIVDWRRDWCLGQLRLPGCAADLGLPDMTVAEAAGQGARTMVVGIVNAGGVLNEAWVPVIVNALEAGMDVASGLHIRLGSDPRIAEAARTHGRELFDARHSQQRFATGKGTKRSGLRLLTVGTDCSVGKKYTALALEREMRERGADAEFRATGQTGVFISGRGVAIDAVVADFISGAVEWIAPEASPRHWDLVEGQGSLFHPSFAGVTMGLLHGAQPDAFVVCHEPTRTTMRGVQHPLPTIAEVIDLTIRCGRLTNPAIRPVGIAVNTQALGEQEAKSYLAETARSHDLPASDPIRFGVGAIVDRLEAEFPRDRIGTGTLTQMDAATPEPIKTARLAPEDIRSIFFGLMLAMLLSALDQTIVATAMPTIGRELGNLDQLPWIVTAYLLASTAVTPLYGKFSDMHGRRVTLLIGILVFVLGSVACAVAPTMLTLILARGLQGLGGGGLIALSQTIVADMVTPRERGRYQVYFGAVFASASIGGPVLGGFFAENLHWSFIFWINLPLGFLAFWLTNDRLRKLPQTERRHKLDVLGSLLLVGATVSLMLVLSWGGVRFPWSSATILTLAGTSAALWVGFLFRMASAREPLIPLTLLRDPVIGLSALSSALGMGTYIGLTIFVPIYMEAALGYSARQSGLALIPLMVGVVCGATASGQTMARVRHYKRAPLAGLSVATVCVATIAYGTSSLPFWALESLMFLTSVGLGTLMPVATVSTQNAAPPGHLGTATATMNFSRQLMGAMIVALFGAIVLSGHGGHALTLENLSAGGSPELAQTFRWVFGVAALGLGASFLVFTAMEERPFRDRLASAPAAD